MKKLIAVGLGAALVLLAAYQVLMYVDNHSPFGRMWETPALRPYEEKAPLMQSGLVPFSGGEAFYRLAPPQDIASPLDQNDPLVIAQGKVLYLSYCVHCHGRQFDGLGTVGQSFEPLPGDLRSSKVQAMPVGQVFKEISYGLKGGRQPPLATTIDILDRWKVIAYVKSLGVRDF
jgi:mono/diheme cytochrome c family protein